jgi:hypothetical protein
MIHFAVIGLALTLILTYAAAQRVPSQPRTGEDWLALTPALRTYFIDAYVSGYLSGKVDACIAASELFEVGKSYTNLDDLPDRRCYRKAPSYSRNLDDYVKTITDFYTQYPQFRGISEFELMHILTDDQYTTADGIYQKATRGEIRTR